MYFCYGSRYGSRPRNRAYFSTSASKNISIISESPTKPDYNELIERMEKHPGKTLDELVARLPAFDPFARCANCGYSNINDEPCNDPRPTKSCWKNGKAKGVIHIHRRCHFCKKEWLESLTY